MDALAVLLNHFLTLPRGYVNSGAAGGDVGQTIDIVMKFVGLPRQRL